MPATRKRTALSKELQVRVFRRDRWMCRWCGRPVVFPPAMRMLDRLVRLSGYDGALAYHDPRWRRDRAPLLDHLGAVVDHHEAFARGGAHDESNFVTSCNKCNARKNSSAVAEFTEKSPLRLVKGKYGEPTDWDGFSTVFVVLARTNEDDLTDGERGWLDALGRDDPRARLRRRIARDTDGQLRLVAPERRALVELIGTMLPSPVSGTTTLIGGDPGEVVVVVGEDVTEVMQFEVEWVSEHEPATFGTLVAAFKPDAEPAPIAAAIAQARARRVSTYRWCPTCRSVQPPEWMMDEQCMSCFERAGGVF